MEREAHLFAGALLLPAEDMSRTVQRNATLSDFLKIKSGWGASIAASISRARALGIISSERYRSLQIQLSSRGMAQTGTRQCGGRSIRCCSSR